MKHFALALLIACFASAALADNWPGFRGPTGQGISSESNLPTRWSATENIAWKSEIPGLGWSSPIVWGDRVFLTTATDNGVSCRLLCLDRKSGKMLWDKEVFQQPIKRKENKNSFATPTPVTDGQLIYAVFNDGSIAALDFDGKVAWTNRSVPYYSQHGLGNSPILFEDLLIMPFDPSSEGPDKQVGWKKPWDKAVILALDKKTGQEKYRAKRGLSRIAHVTPVLFKEADRVQLISAAGDVLQSHNARTGELIWKIYGQGEGVVPSPVIGDGVVFACSGFEKPTIRAVRLDGKGDVTKTHILWEQTEQVPTQPSLLYAQGLLFSIKENGFAQCIDPKSGKILWSQRLDGNYSASPVFAGGRIYFLSESAQTTVIEAANQLQLVARNGLEVEKCQASIAVSQNQLFIRTEKHLYCIGK